jgi:hypothetical protein
MQRNDRLRNKSFDSCLHFWHVSVSSELLTVLSVQRQSIVLREILASKERSRLTHLVVYVPYYRQLNKYKMDMV